LPPFEMSAGLLAQDFLLGRQLCVLFFVIEPSVHGTKK